LDIATVTGWCYGAPGLPPRFGSLRFGKPGTPRDACYRMFRTWVSDTLDSLEPNLVVFESTAVSSSMGGKTTIEVMKRLIGLCEHLEEICYQRVELREANISSIRHHFINCSPKRDIAKARTMERCKALGWNVSDDNEADACALWDYQVSCLRPDLAAVSTPLFYGKTVDGRK
jgi:hypothetical protein